LPYSAAKSLQRSDQDYFSDGITDALTTELAQIGALSVVSRTSAEHFKGARETLPEIGRALNVEAIVEGSVTRSENRVRITAQLIDAPSYRHLWAKSYERDLKDVLALLDEVARDIAEEIRVKRTPEERTPPDGRLARNVAGCSVRERRSG
jgi:TolB-like protein